MRTGATQATSGTTDSNHVETRTVNRLPRCEHSIRLNVTSEMSYKDIQCSAGRGTTEHETTFYQIFAVPVNIFLDD